VNGVGLATGDVREGGRWTARQRLKNDVIYLSARVALALVARLPRSVVRWVCRALAILAWVVRGRERALCRARLEAGTGASVPASRVRRAFREAGETLADTLALLDPDELPGRTLAVDPEGRAVFRAALEEGRGVVFVSAHLGSWERLAAVFAAEGFPVATVARESYDPRFTLLYDRLRAPRGVRAIYRGRPGATTTIVRELRAGRAVGFLIDLPSRVPCRSAHLFGAEADVPLGAARIALARGAAVLVGTCGRGSGDGRSRVGVIQVTRVLTADLAAGAGRSGGQGREAALVQRLAAELDARIAEAPERWLGLFVPPRRQVGEA
jgi:KDO2-lipid IV(A) lauroyltransferase